MRFNGGSREQALKCGVSMRSSGREEGFYVCRHALNQFTRRTLPPPCGRVREARTFRFLAETPGKNELQPGIPERSRENGKIPGNNATLVVE